MLSRLLMLTTWLSLSAISQANPFTIETLAENLGIPWGMDFVREDKLLFTTRDGHIGLLDTETKKLQWISGQPTIESYGQGGLLDVRYHTGSQYLYFTYAKKLSDQGLLKNTLLSSNEHATTLARAQLSEVHNKPVLINWQDLFITQSASDSGQHFGSRIAFDGNGHIFFSVGDRGHRPNGQDLSTHAGTVVRLTLDGKVPVDNPFVDRKDALPEIWSYGHRNPQGLAFDYGNQRLWLIEHGPRGGDEINLVKPGHNYGWPLVSHGKEYWGPVAVGEGTQREGIESPVKIYIPSIAPSSLLLYKGKAFPRWQGNLFSGALKLRHINRVIPNQDFKEERLQEGLNERIRSLASDSQGRILFSTDSGKIMRLSPPTQLNN